MTLNRLFETAEAAIRNDDEQSAQSSQPHGVTGEKIEDDQVQNEQLDHDCRSVDLTDDTGKKMRSLRQLPLTMLLVIQGLHSSLYSVSLWMPPRSTSALGDTDLLLCVGIIRLLLLVPIIEAFMELNHGTKRREDDWSWALGPFRIVMLMLMALQMYSLLKWCEWDVIFIVLKLLTTFTRNDAVRTLVTDFIFGSVGVKKYARLEMKRVEERFMQEMHEEQAKEEA